jgi:transposase-like protein
MEPVTLGKVAGVFADEGAAWEFFETLRWPDGKAICAHCGSQDVLYLKPRNGGRTTRTGAITQRRVWRCRECKRQFSAIVGTIFEGSKIPLGKWMMAVYLFCSAKNGVSAHELHRDLGITYKSAWYMTQRIREAMAHSPAGSLLGTTVVIDEAYIGGKPANRHAKDRKNDTGYGRGRGSDKAAVVSMVDADTGEVRSAVVADVTGGTMMRLLADNTDRAMTTIHTDAFQTYKQAAIHMAGHHSVDHSAGEYVSEKSLGTNKAENFFSQLKRSLDGTHHNVSREHLQRYVREFDYRATTRKVTDGMRMADVVGRSYGQTLSYAELIADGPVARGTRRRPPGRRGPRQSKPSSLPQTSRGEG